MPMKNFMLPPDDLAPIPTRLDQIWQLQLEESVSQRFYDGCDRLTQTLLAQCQWSITTIDVPTLTIACPDTETYWNLVSNIKNISKYLSLVTRASRIEVIPKNKKNISFEVEVGG